MNSDPLHSIAIAAKTCQNLSSACCLRVLVLLEYHLGFVDIVSMRRIDLHQLDVEAISYTCTLAIMCACAWVCVHVQVRACANRTLETLLT